VSASGHRRWRGRLLLPEGVAVGALEAMGGRIVAVVPDGGGLGRGAEGGGTRGEGDAPGPPWIVPGFIDVHVHGGGGGDTMDGPDGVRALAAAHLRHGTTALLASTLTADWPDVLAALRGVAQVVAEDAAAEDARSSDAAPTIDGAPPGGGARAPRARVLGAHLEGPFINPGRLGAQPPFAVAPTAERVAEVLALGVVRTVTLAPELDGALAAVARFAAAGVVVALGHTRADADTVAAAFAAARAAADAAGVGVNVSATHLFNAMGGMSGREPGVVGGVLGDRAAYAELIVDGHHVAPAAVRAAFNAKPDRTLLITDAIRAAGLGDGPTTLGGRPVTVTGGAARLPDGTLAGSLLTMDAAVRRAVAMGVGPEAALRAATYAPAELLGLLDRGRLQIGARADVLVLGPELELLEVWQAGARVA